MLAAIRQLAAVLVRISPRFYVAVQIRQQRMEDRRSAVNGYATCDFHGLIAPSEATTV